MNSRIPRRRIRRFLLGSLAAALAFPVSSSASEKIPVTTQDELPRHTYAIDGSITELVSSWEKLSPLAGEIRADLEADLEKYDIQDKATLKGIYGTLLVIDLAEERWDDALERVELLRGLEEKAAAKAMAGLGTEARVAAVREVGLENEKEFRAAFRRHYAERVNALSWDVVQDLVESNKSQLEMLSENLVLGLVEQQLEPVVAESGELSGQLANQVIGLYNALHVTLVVKADIIEVLDEYIRAHRVEKEDIWAARSLDLTGREDLAPVRIAVWDTGVDPSVFGDRMFVNPNERLDGKDTDGNGFVDDVHGIAWDVHWLPTSGALFPMDEATRPISELQAEAKGLFDMRASLDTPESQALRQRMASLGKDDVKTFLEDLTRYTMYSHGTHVAGIAAEANPSASVLYCRLTADVQIVPPAPTLEDARNSAAAFEKIIDYYREHDVRVVNMSWVVARSSFESALEVNNVGESAEERKELARQMFDIPKVALEKAFRSAPGILFVGGAGNSDNDITFDEFFPPMFDLPNLLIAGAVDQAGQATSFTSFGPTVNVYANGFEVESYVPGGDRVKFSGTSMASPNVANLAAKLIALDPSLTPPEVIELIREGADEVQEGEQTMRVIHPQRSAALLDERKGSM